MDMDINILVIVAIVMTTKDTYSNINKENEIFIQSLLKTAQEHCRSFYALALNLNSITLTS